MEKIIVVLVALFMISGCTDDGYREQQDERRRAARGVYEVVLDGQEPEIIENAYCYEFSPGFGSELYIRCFSKVFAQLLRNGEYRIHPDRDTEFLLGRLEVMRIIESEG